jgi:hypothetical protein
VRRAGSGQLILYSAREWSGPAGTRGTTNTNLPAGAVGDVPVVGRDGLTVSPLHVDDDGGGGDVDGAVGGFELHGDDDVHVAGDELVRGHRASLVVLSPGGASVVRLTACPP